MGTPWVFAFCTQVTRALAKPWGFVSTGTLALQPLALVWVTVKLPPVEPLVPVPQGVIQTVTPFCAADLAMVSPSPYRTRSNVRPAPFVVDQRKSASDAFLKLPDHALETPKPVIFC